MKKKNSKCNIEMLIRKGYKLHKKGFLSGAMKVYKNALQLCPNDERLHYYLGYLYSQQEKHYKAIEEYEKAARINPNNYWTYNNLGLSLQTENNLKEAIRAFKKAIKLNPGRDTAHFNLGRLYAQDKKWFKESIKELKKAVKLNPSNTSNYYGLGLMYEEIDKIQEAVKIHKRILNLQPKNKPAKEALKRLSAKRKASRKRNS